MAYRFAASFPRYSLLDSPGIRSPLPAYQKPRASHPDLPGDLTWMAIPVPFPNTAVKHPGPMVVLQGRE